MAVGAHRIMMRKFRLEYTEQMALRRNVFSFVVAITVVFVFTNAGLGQIAVQSSNALATANDRSTGVMVRGIEADDLRSLNLWTGVASADFAAGRHAVIGRQVADALAVKVGDQFLLIDPQGTRTAFGVAPRTATFKVAAVIELAPSAEATITVYVSRRGLEELSGGAP